MLIYDELLQDIIDEFQIGSEKNITLHQKIGSGYSGAGVYLVELKNPSIYIGFFFLKIDDDPKEFEIDCRAIRFSSVACRVNQKKIRDKYVILSAVAGLDAGRFRPLYDITIPQIRNKSVSTIMSNMLKQAFNRNNPVYTGVAPCRIFSKHLGDKLTDEAKLHNYLSCIFQTYHPESVVSFVLNGRILPSAFAYGRNDNLWNSILLSEPIACSHGDLHGNNVLVSDDGNEYALIDMANYHEDGFLFYDSSYLLLSILLQSFGNSSLDDWIRIVEELVAENWENAEWSNAGVCRTIGESERNFIEMLNGTDFNYAEAMRDARFIARILAGLNYSGKWRVTEEIRSKSFLFSCIYLNKLLDNKNIEVRRGDHSIVDWHSISEIEQRSKDDLSSFTEAQGDFASFGKYVLIIGDKCNYAESIASLLSRIPWNGIITFSHKDNGTERAILKSNPQLMYDCESVDKLTSKKTWCMFANGVHYECGTIFDEFRNWGKNYRSVLERFRGKLGTAVAPDDIQFIVDADSFSDECTKKLHWLIVTINDIENASIRLSVLYKRNRLDLSNAALEEDAYAYYQIGAEMLADYCYRYLPGETLDKFLVPRYESPIGATLSDDKYNLIKSSRITFVHDGLPRAEGSLSPMKENAFYYGDKISWTAISDELFVNRKELETYTSDARKKLEQDEAVGVLQIMHTPGAGASVISRTICWRMHKEYPTVILEDSINDAVMECMEAIYNVSSKKILILADGGYAYSDILALKSWLIQRHIKACIIHTCRSSKGRNVLAEMDVDDGRSFKRRYVEQMKYLKDYTVEQYAQRAANLESLTSNVSMAEFRLPFFYGLFTFEDDFVGMDEYCKNIHQISLEGGLVWKFVRYAALITYYSPGKGIHLSHARKLLEKRQDCSFKVIRDEINEKVPHLIKCELSEFCICHPVIALRILRVEYDSFQSVAFEQFCEDFITDIRQCEGTGGTTDRLNELMISLFTSREIIMDEYDGAKRKPFSQLVTDLGNAHLRQQLFGKLVAEIPLNAHFHQHYGRLLIHNFPNDIDKAKIEYDTAIMLEPDNPMHHHALGDMYVKHVRSICTSSMQERENDRLNALYDKISIFVENAISAFECTIDIIVNHGPGGVFDLVYPYCSIIELSTYAVNKLFVNSGARYPDEYSFYVSDTNISKWCQNIIGKAFGYDMAATTWYDDLSRNSSYFDRIRNYLRKYESTPDAMIKAIRRHPERNDLKYAYVSSIRRDKNIWETMNQADLRLIEGYCYDLMKSPTAYGDGLLWYWFYASIFQNGWDASRMLGVLETHPNLSKSLCANFFLMILYFLRFLQVMNPQDIEFIHQQIRMCRALSRHTLATKTQFYLSPGGGIALSRENAAECCGYVCKCKDWKNGEIALDVSKNLRAFFIPSFTDMSPSTAEGMKVRMKLGFSYDGLRAWDVVAI